MKMRIILLVLSILLVWGALIYRSKLFQIAIKNTMAINDGGNHAFQMGTYAGIIIAVAVCFVAIAVRSIFEVIRSKKSSGVK